MLSNFNNFKDDRALLENHKKQLIDEIKKVSLDTVKELEAIEINLKY